VKSFQKIIIIRIIYAKKIEENGEKENMKKVWFDLMLKII